MKPFYFVLQLKIQCHKMCLAPDFSVYCMSMEYVVSTVVLAYFWAWRAISAYRDNTVILDSNQLDKVLSLTAISVDSALSLTALSEFAIVCKILRRPRGIKLSQQFRPKNILAQYVLIFRLKHFHCNFCSKLIFLKLNCSNLHHIRILEFL